MKILAIDTSTKFLCLGLYDDGRVYEYNLELGRKLSALMVPAISRAIEALGWKISQVDYFACGIGPGSFTGLRVGLSVIKGLCFSLNKPVVAVPTLDILAQNAASIPGDYVMPAIDAKRGLIYCAIYRQKNKKLQKISPYMLLSQKEFFGKAKRKTVILGDALDLYRPNAVLLDKDYWRVEARYLLELSLERIRKKKITDCFRVKPIYLYPQECQIKR